MNNDILTVGNISEEYSVCTIKESINMNNEELSKNVNRMVHRDNAQKDTTSIVNIKKVSCNIIQAEIVLLDSKANRMRHRYIFYSTLLISTRSLTLCVSKS